MLDLGNWGWFRFRGTWSFLRTWNRIELHRFQHKLQMEIAWKLPLWLVNWSVVRAASTAMDEYDIAPDKITYKYMFDATNPYRRKLDESTEPGDGDPVGGEPAEV